MIKATITVIIGLLIVADGAQAEEKEKEHEFLGRGGTRRRG